MLDKIINKVIGFVLMIVAGFAAALFYFKKKSLDEAIKENKEIASKEQEIKNEAKNLEDTFLDDAITSKLKDQG